MSGRGRGRGRHGDRLSRLFPQSRPRGGDASRSGSASGSGTGGDIIGTGGSTSSGAPPSSTASAVDTHSRSRCYISDLGYVLTLNINYCENVFDK